MNLISVVQETSVDVNSNKSDKDIDSDPLEMQMERKRLEDDRFRSDTHDRRWLARWSAGLVSLWLYAVICIVASGQFLNISDQVLITLLATTTLNVLGISYIVLRGHFEKKV